MMQTAEGYSPGRTQIQIVLDAVQKVVDSATMNKSNYVSDIASAFNVTDPAEGLTRLLWLTELLAQADEMIQLQVSNPQARDKHSKTIRLLSEHVVLLTNTERKPVPVRQDLLADAATCDVELSHYSVPMEIAKNHLDRLSEYLTELKAMPSFDGDPDEFDKWTEMALIGLQNAIRDYPMLGVVAFEKHLADLVFRMARAQRNTDRPEPRSEKARKTKEFVFYALELTDDLHGYSPPNRQFSALTLPPAVVVELPDPIVIAPTRP